jgi:hypothetical protein
MTRRWILALLFSAICATLIIFSAVCYYRDRMKPGGDRVRERYLKRRSCEAEAHVVYEKCMQQIKIKKD